MILDIETNLAMVEINRAIMNEASNEAVRVHKEYDDIIALKNIESIIVYIAKYCTVRTWHNLQ